MKRPGYHFDVFTIYDAVTQLMQIQCRVHCICISIVGLGPYVVAKLYARCFPLTHRCTCIPLTSYSETESGFILVMYEKQEIITVTDQDKHS